MVIMLYLIRASSSLVIFLTLLGAFSTTVDVSMNKTQSLNSAAKTEASRDFVLFVETSLEEQIIQDLKRPKSFKMPSNSILPSSFSSCPGGPWTNQKDSFYIAVSSGTSSGLQLFLCEFHETTAYFLLVSHFLLKSSENSQKSLVKSVISELFSMKTSEAMFKIVPFKLCDRGINSIDLSCLSRYRRTELTLEQKYDILVGTGVTYAVVKLAGDPLLTSAFHGQLVDNLYSYVFDSTGSLSNTVTSFDEFEEVYDCLIELLSDPNGLALEIPEANLHKLLFISSSAQSVNELTRLLNSEKINLARLADYYLSRFSSKYSPDSAEFLSALQKTTKTLNDYYSLVSSGGRLNEFHKFSVFSSETGRKSVTVQVLAQFGDQLNCSCSFCSNTEIIMVVDLSLTHFGPGSEIRSIQAYLTGEVVSGAQIVYFEKPFALTATDLCYSQELRLVIDHNKEIAWMCLSSEFTKPCKYLKIDGDFAVVQINQFGTFEVKRVCHEKLGYEENGIDCKPGCLENCLCNLFDVCAVCWTGYKKDFWNTCTLCEDGFGKDPNERCVTCPFNCLKCFNGSCLECQAGYLVDDHGQCARCEAGYRWNQFFECVCDYGFAKNDFGLCKPCQKNCQCDSAGLCTSCLPAYHRGSDNSCSVCSPGHALDKNSLVCEACGLNCLCSAPGLCDSCLENYEKDSDNSCGKCKEGYVKDKYGKCTECTKGYVKYLGYCEKCLSGCQCSYPNTCDFCLDGFTAISYSPPICKSCSSSSCLCSIPDTCSLCRPGWARDLDGLCSPCDDHCVCSKPATCDYCEGGYIKDQLGRCTLCDIGFGIQDQASCAQCLPNCECSKAYTCDKCLAGFAFDGLGTCQPCRPNCNCSKPFTCDSCQEAFGLGKNFECEPCQTNCLCQIAGQCEGCRENFEFSDRACVTCSEKYRNQFSLCSDCSDGYGHQGKTCEKCQKNCKCFWSFGCDDCLIGYLKDSSDQCTLCSPGYGKSSDDTCLPCSQFCLCLKASECDSCLPGYSKDLKGFCNICDSGVINNFGFICHDCLAGYFKSQSNLCKKCSEGCRCQSENSCSDCLDGFYFDDFSKTCIKCLKTGCACSAYSQCDWCLEGYAFGDHNLCQPCDAHCICDLQGGCNACQAGYKKDKSGKCSLCQPGFGKDTNGDCKPCVYGCLCEKAYDCDSCIELKFGINIHNYCEPCPDNCFCKYSNKCDQCPDGFGLSNSGKCEPCLNHCKCNEANTCSECLEPFGMNSKGECTVCQQGYLQDESGQCSFCDVGYGVSLDGLKLCQKCKDGCFCQTAGMCDGCILGYGYLDYATSCAPCQNGCFCTWMGKCYGCLSGFTNFGINFNCLPCQENCECRYPGTCDYCKLGYSKDKDGNCNLCAEGFGKTSHGSCLKCAANCKCLNFQECDSCLPGHTFNSTTRSCMKCPTGCECSNQLICDSCLSGFFMNSLNICESCPINCICSNSSSCEACLKNYELDSFGQCSLCSASSHLISVHSTCDTCIRGYYKSALGTCEPCQYGCECSASHKCQSCLSGFFSDSYGGCTRCQYPLMSDESGNCALCAQGFYFSETFRSCFACSAGCACNKPETCSYCISSNVFNSFWQCSKCQNGCECLEPWTCLKCLEGFIFDDATQTCLPCPGNCGCKKLGTCDYCLEGYAFGDPGPCGKCADGFGHEGTVCRPCKNNCVCSFAGECDRCIPGFWMDVQVRICRPCPNNCFCDVEAVCISCKHGFALDFITKTCLPCMENCRCTVPNTCDACLAFATQDEGGKCSVCHVGYKSIEGSCNYCDQGFGRDKDGLCAPCDQGCICEKSDSCDSCKSGFGRNKFGFCETCQMNCFCQLAHTCDTCYPGFAKDDQGGCSRCSNNCLCDSLYQCDSCIRGFKLDRGSCRTCDVGFVFVADTKECRACKPGCKCDSPGECSECLPNNVKDQSGSCVACLEGFKKDELGRCIVCEEGFSYHYESNQCLRCIDHCDCSFELKNNIITQICKECQAGFGFDDTLRSCLPCIENCDCFYANMCDKCLPGYESEGTKCSKCSSGYFKSGDLCIKCNSFCQCDSSSLCLSCLPGFGFSSESKCEPCESNCFCKTSAQCDSCLPGFGYFEGQCLPCLTHCNCFNAFTCLSCQEGYQLSAGGCQKCSSRYSLNRKTGLCDICSPGYAKDQNGLCYDCADGYGRDYFSDSCLPCKSGCSCKYSDYSMTSCDKCLNAFQGAACETCKETYASHLDRCDSCKLGYARDYLNLCEPCQEGCFCNHAGSCAYCATGFYFDETSKTCKPCQSGCECNTKDDCLHCLRGFSATPEGSCRKCREGCECDEQNECVACLEGFYFDGNCKPCKPGFFVPDYFSGTTCVECPTGCICSYNFECRGCIEGFVFNIVTRTCEKCSDGCKCQVSNTCDSCMTGFGKHPDFTQECLPCKKNCFCSISNTCQGCLPGYKMGADLECSLCDDGYFAYYQTSSFYSLEIFDIRCEVCAPGFYLSGNKCLSCLEGCKCSVSQTCTSCLPGYIQIGNRSSADSFYCSKCAENCNCSHPGGCLECIPGYTFDEQGQCSVCEKGFGINKNSKKCEPCLAFCHCSEARTCDGCIYPSIQYQNGLCNYCETGTAPGPTGECTCHDGFYLNQSNACASCPEGCHCSNHQNCFSCLPGYFMNQLKTCEQLPLGCSELAEDASCESCSTGFYLQGNSCEKCQTNCACENSEDLCEYCEYYASEVDGKCAACVEGFAPDETGWCLPCQPGCSCSVPGTCSACLAGHLMTDKGSCNSCDKGYYLMGLECHKCKAFCYCMNFKQCIKCFEGHAFTNKGDCSICETGYKKDFRGSCSLCDLGYKKDNKGKCSLCDSGYAKDLSGLCLPCLKNCLCLSPASCDRCLEGFARDMNEMCQVCLPGYAFNEQKLCKPCSQGCECLTPGECLKCRIGFAPDEQGSCSLCTQGYAADENNTCQACLAFCNCFKPNTCESCLTGYKFNQKLQTCEACAEGFGKLVTNYERCLPCQPNCLCNFENQCDQCVEGFEMISNSCTNCLQGFIKVGSACQSCGLNCVCDEPKTCRNCTTGYQKDSQGMCSLCDEGFGKEQTSGKCLPCESQCTCQIAGQCSGCKLGYVLTEGQCFAGSLFFSPDYVNSFKFDEFLLRLELVSSRPIDSQSVGTMGCFGYFRNSEILGQGASCTLRDKFTLVVLLGKDWTVSPTNGLHVEDLFRVTEGNFILFPWAYLQPAYPENLDLDPKAIITGPTELASTCDGQSSAYYSASSSSGVFKDRFSFFWSSPQDVIISDPLKETIMLSLKSEPLNYFQLTLTVNNGVGSAGSSTFHVKVRNFKLISFTFDIAQGTSVKRSQSLTVSPVSVNYCGLFGSPEYLWTVTPEVPGLVLGQSKLRIPTNTLKYGVYNLGLELTLGNVKGVGFTSINVEPSELVVILNKGNQEISNIFDLEVSASSSFDPDGFPLEYSWSVNSKIWEAGVHMSSILIPKTFFSSLSSLDLSLTLSSTEGSRSASSVIHLTIKEDLKLKVSVTGSSKAPLSTMTNLRSIATKDSSISSISYKWSQVSGPNIAEERISGLLMSSMTISKNSLIGGASYGFLLTVSGKNSNGITGSATAEVFFTSNLPAFCTGSALVEPKSGVQLMTKFTFSVSGCYDEDAVDVPLTYKAYLSKSGKSSLITTSKSPVISNLPLTLGITALSYEVCDTLGDCFSTSASVSVTKTSRNLEELNLAQLYSELKLEFGVVFAVSLILDEFAVQKNLLDVMWLDFSRFIQEEEADSDTFEEMASTLTAFLSDIQDFRLKQHYSQKYAELLIQFLEKNICINLNSENSVIVVASKISQLEGEKFKILALEVLKRLADKKNQVLNEFYGVSQDVEIFVLNNFFSTFKGKDLQVGTSFVRISEVGVENNEFLTVSIQIVKDFFRVSLTTSEKYLDGQFIPKEVRKIKIPKDSVFIKLDKTRLSQGFNQCIILDSEESHDSCQITEKDKDFVTVMIRSNGIFTLVHKKESTRQNFAPLYLMLSLTALASIFTAFLVLFRGKVIQTQSSGDLTITTNKTFDDIGSKENLESGEELIKREVFHLTFGLFCKRCFVDKKLALWLILANISSAFLLEILAAEFLDVNYYIIGCTSPLIVLPLSTILCLLMSRKTYLPKLIGGFLVFVIICISHVGVSVLKINKGWETTLLLGILTEVLVSETLVMLAFNIMSKFK